jgi:acyl carrier protein
MQVRERLRQFVIQNFLFGRQNGLNDDDSFLENGIIDSTGVLELVAFLEETYGFRVENDELTTEHFDSINKVSAYVRSKLDVAGARGVPATQETEGRPGL